MPKPLSILYVSSEVVPFAKTGGLADVSGALPQVIREMGHDIRIIMPKYATVSDRKFKIHDIKRLTDMPIEIGDKTYLSSVKSSFLTNIRTKVQVYFVSNDDLYCRSDLYIDPKTKEGWPDNDDRFIFFCKSVIETMLLLGWKPDIIHLNDWQSAILAPMIKTMYAKEPLFKNTKIVFTIHNAAYQGIFPADTFEKTDLPQKVMTPDGMEYHGNVNFMKAGLQYADYITTVSKTYSKEIQESNDFGFGLEGIFKKKSRKLTGILNGMDTDVWNPEDDEHIPAHYSKKDFSGKVENKKALLERFKLPYDEKVPVIGIVTRLVDQKGLDLIEKRLDNMLKLKCQIVVLGSGQKEYEKMLQAAAKKNKKQVGVEIGFDEALAHLIEAGSDMFLMPSKYEPCGLNQMYSLRYGTLPIVRATGGLADTVIDLNENPKKGNGFVFDEYKAPKLLDAVKRAVKAYGDRENWEAAMKRAMSADFSWNRSADKYVELYRKLLKKK
ncbi:MAG: glycogen synthase GlgA [Ectothiorhodospiraceae bacterium]|nr:glycogen synthase GlgA [Ectothiorhodospiraceae bacterium]